MGIPGPPARYLFAALLLAVALVTMAWPVFADPELCNGIDDDDDGETDEEVIDCADDESCYYGLCLVDCSDDPDACTSQYVCFNGYCHITWCDGEMLCPEGWICEQVDWEVFCIPDVCNVFAPFQLPCGDNPFCCSEGFTPPCHCDAISTQCVDACYGVTCPEGFVCIPEDGGTCHPMDEDCYIPDPPCFEGQHCVDQQCVDDPCFEVECAEGLYCNLDGDCVEPCQVDCPDGCFENECVDDPCAGVLCEPGLSCDDGECVMGDCWGVDCDHFQVCVDGECIHDPCWNVECPNCFVCIGGGCYAYDPDADDEPDTDSDDEPDTDSDSETDTDSGATGATTPAKIETRCSCEVVGMTAGHGLLELVGGLFF